MVQNEAIISPEGTGVTSNCKIHNTLFQYYLQKSFQINGASLFQHLPYPKSSASFFKQTSMKSKKPTNQPTTKNPGRLPPKVLHWKQTPSGGAFWGTPKSQLCKCTRVIFQTNFLTLVALGPLCSSRPSSRKDRDAIS